MAGLRAVFPDEEPARFAPHLLRDRFLDRLAVRQLTHAHDSSVSIRCVGTTKRWMGTPCGQPPWHGWPEQERQGAAPAESMAYPLLASFTSPQSTAYIRVRRTSPIGTPPGDGGRHS